MSEYDHAQQYTDHVARASSLYPGVTASPSPNQFCAAPPAAVLYGAATAADFGQWQSHASAAASSYASGMRGAYPQHGLISHPSLAGRFSPTMFQTMHQNIQHSFGHAAVGHNGFGMMSAAHHANAAAAAVGFGTAAGNTMLHGVGMTPGVVIKEEQHHLTQHRADRIGHLSSINSCEAPKPKKPHIKKPLNAFMLFMKEMRSKVVAECTLKESAAINQILGRKWHALTREDQAKYYEMARKEKELHMQLYPGWSARDNYAAAAKRSSDGDMGMKKMRHPYTMIDSGGQSWCRSGEATDFNTFYEQQKSYHHGLSALPTHYPHHMIMAGANNADYSPTGMCLTADSLRASKAAVAAAGVVSSAYEQAAAQHAAQVAHQAAQHAAAQVASRMHPLSLKQDEQLTLTDLS